MKIKLQDFVEDCILDAKESKMVNAWLVEASMGHKLPDLQTTDADSASTRREQVKSLFEDDYVVGCSLRHLNNEVNENFNSLRKLIDNEFFGGEFKVSDITTFDLFVKYWTIEFICEENKNNLPQFAEICSFVKKVSLLREKLEIFITTSGCYLLSNLYYPHLCFELDCTVSDLHREQNLCIEFSQRESDKIKEFKLAFADLEAVFTGKKPVDSLSGVEELLAGEFEANSLGDSEVWPAFIDEINSMGDLDVSEDLAV